MSVNSAAPTCRAEEVGARGATFLNGVDVPEKEEFVDDWSQPAAGKAMLQLKDAVDGSTASAEKHVPARIGN